MPAGWQPTVSIDARRQPSGRRWTPLLWTAGIVVLLAAAGTFMALRLPPGTTLAGVPVDDATDVPAALAAAQDHLDQLTFRFTTTVGTQTEATGRELGLEIDEDASTDPVRRGLPSLTRWLRRLPDGPQHLPFRTRPLPPDPLAEVARSVSKEPIDVQVVIQPAGVQVNDGADGVDVDAGQVDAALDDSLTTVASLSHSQWPEAVEVPIDGSVPPPTVTQADLDALLERVAEVEDAAVRLTADTLVPGTEDRTATSITLTPRELRDLMGVSVVDGAEDGQRLQLVPDIESPPARLIALLDLARAEPTVTARVDNRSPTPERGEDVADISTVSGDVVIEEAEGGFEPDREATLTALFQAALQGGGDVQVAGSEAPVPTAEELGIIQPVSTFTTFYTAGQSRNQNIQRMAEIIDGTVIPAGESLELNRAVGQRTRANGFTDGGAIVDGELVSAVGGGVSQFATTFFNAAWFAGIELVDWKPHSIYFPRYPAGREATINYPNVNLEVRNDTPYAILVDTTADDTSVTVTFWSTPYWQVETITGPCACGGEFYMTVDRIRQTVESAPVRESYTTLYVLPEEGDDEGH